MKSNKLLTTVKKISVPFLMLLISFLLTAILMLIIGGNPVLAYVSMFKGAFSSKSSVIAVIQRAVPTAVCAFGVMLCSKGGLFNIGLEGQLLMGALGSIVGGVYFTGLPAPLHILATLLTAMLFGMIWAVIPAVMLVERKVIFVVTSLFMNIIAGNVIQYFIFGPLKGTDLVQPSTKSIAETAQFPNIMTSPKLSYAFVLVIVVAIVFGIFIKRTYSGYELRVIGGNKQAARFAGIDTRKYTYLVILAAGALAGMAGSIDIQGRYYRLIDGFSPGYGWDALPIALLAGTSPIGAIAASILFSAMHIGASTMQIEAKIPFLIISVIQGFLLLAIAMDRVLRSLVARRRSDKSGAADDKGEKEEAES